MLQYLVALALSATIQATPLTPSDPQPARATSSATSAPCAATIQELCDDIQMSLSGEVIADGIVGVEWETTREPSGLSYRVEVGDEQRIRQRGSCVSGDGYVVLSATADTVVLEVRQHGQVVCTVSAPVFQR